MPTPILGIPELTPGQSNKTTTMNDMVVAVENATQATSLLNVNTGHVTLSAAQFTGAAMFVAQSLTADSTVTIPNTPRVFGIRNTSTAYNLVVGRTAGATATVAATAAAQLQSDGTNTTVLAQGGIGPQGPTGPAGAISTIVAGAMLSGGTILDNTGTIALGAIGSGHMIANTGTGTAVPSDQSLSAFLDFVLGSSTGNLLHRASTGWVALAPGSSGQVLQYGTDTKWSTLVGTNFTLASSGTVTLGGIELAANKGASNGYAGLDSGGRVPAAQLPAAVTGALSFTGAWNASTNSPTLTNTPAAQGNFYIVTTAGTTALTTRTGSVTQWNLGDVIFSDGTYWDKLDGQSSEVVTVAGRTGVVTLTHSDLTDWASATSGFLTSQQWNAGTVTSLAGAAIGSGTLAVTYGTVAGTAAQGNDSRITGAEQTANKGIAGGYAGLDGSGKVPTANLPAAVAGALSFAGAWDANANSPTLTNTPAVQGNFYIVTTAGTTSLTTRTGTVAQWNLGDVIFSDGTFWDKLDGQSTEVVTVAGRTGAVTLTHADITDWAASIGWTATQVTALGTGVSIASGTLSATGSGGSVTQVGLAAPVEFTVSGSPVNTAGTLTFVKATQSANAVWAGPTTGAAAAPAFRALVAADVPVMVGSGASHAAGAVPDPGSTAGTTRYLREDGSWSTVAGAAGGTVTQIIAGSGLSGGTITTTGTVALAAIAAGNLLGNFGTVTAVPQGIVLGTGLTLSAAGTLTAAAGGGGGSSTLAGDTDVAIASIAAGQGLITDGTHWANTTLGLNGTIQSTAGGDANYSSVVLLCHFDGTNGATTTTDAKSHAITLASGAVIDTAQSKFGGSSIRNTTSSTITAAASTDWTFGTGQFTIEGWIRANTYSSSTSYGLVSRWNTSSYAFWLNVGFLGFRNAVGGDIQGAVTITPGTWYHVAVDRDASNNIRVYLNGAVVASTTSAFNFVETSDNLQIGYVGGFGLQFDGWIDDLRITKGLARYAGAFTPPSLAYPAGTTGPVAIMADVALNQVTAGDRLRSDGTHWVNGREPYIVGASIGTITGTVTGQVLFGHRFGAAVTFPANFGTTAAGAVSGADAFANATSACALTLGKCLAASDPTVGGSWTNVGTVSIAAAGHIGTLVSTGGSAIAFALGDKLRVTGNPDTTLANINITLAGDR